MCRGGPRSWGRREQHHDRDISAARESGMPRPELRRTAFERGRQVNCIGRLETVPPTRLSCTIDDVSAHVENSDAAGSEKGVVALKAMPIGERGRDRNDLGNLEGALATKSLSILRCVGTRTVLPSIP